MSCRVLATIVLLFAVTPARSQLVVWEAKLLPPHSQPYEFGEAVAISPTQAVVGEHADSSTYNLGGAVYVFDVTPSGWSLVQKLTPSDARQYRQFGHHLAVLEETLLVGAQDDHGSGPGSAYVFTSTPSGWIETAKLSPTPVSDVKMFGVVGLSESHAIVGAPYDDAGAVDSGSAFIFGRVGEPGGETWSQQAKLVPSDPTSNALFGCSVDVVGPYAIVGAQSATVGGTKSGAAYVFELIDGTWIEVAKLAPPVPQGGDRFGNRVSMDGDLAVVGADCKDTSRSGYACVYRIEGGVWVLDAILHPSLGSAGDRFGKATVSGDLIAVGAMGDDVSAQDQGSVYIFKREAAGWTEEGTITASDGSAGDIFGVVVDLLNGSLIVGASHDDQLAYHGGSAYVYRLNVNAPPLADAGADLEILSAEQTFTEICGAASDPDGDALEFRWREGETVLVGWTPLAPGDPACVDLGTLAGLGLGQHTFTLDVREIAAGGLAASDAMVLTVSNTPPAADAGENLQILSNQQAFTILAGTGSDFDGHALEYRWTEGATLLKDWASVGSEGEAPLDLGTVSDLSLGNHTLTLTVRETQPGGLSGSDEMILTLENSPPEAQPAPSVQEVEIGQDDITLTAQVSDFDGDLVAYEWIAAAGSLGAGWAATLEGGEAVAIPDLTITAGDARFPLGENAVEFRITDGVNDPVSELVMVVVRDTTAPSLQPIPSITILWPPNHTLVPVTIQANAADNGGGAITLDVTVASSEPPDTDGDGNTIPDWYIDSIDQETGAISLRLRSERSGKGDGRTYTITITAVDAAGNAAAAIVEIRAPHDKRKK